ncbi:nucleoside recognition domain-containing protein [Arhodomonas sp. SL1]|uniref:nucleoside recognition domain-containing protein n=1 Tax=Arhodomonas sp. SL1 TaxID=3425691 RepID=UPI003F885321
MNIVFLVIVLVAFFTAAWHQIQYRPPEGGEGDGAVAPMAEVSEAVVESAGGAVELAIGLIGVMTLFLGLMKVAEAGGMLTVLARLIRPLMTRLFPDVPPDHPAMGSMILNISANAMGLGNAATPFGIRAMQELDRLNPHKGTATNSMALFLAINTSSVTLLPTGVIALRASAGSTEPAAILPSTLFATACATVVAVAATKAYQRFSPAPPPDPQKAHAAEEKSDAPIGGGDEAEDPPEHLADAVAGAASGYPLWVSYTFLAGLLGLIPLSIAYGHVIAPWIIPGLIVFFLLYGAVRRVRVYEVFVEGAREGFQVAVRIIPYLVGILVAVGMFRASGAMDALVQWVGGYTEHLGMPAEALPMALLRPLSGSGAYGVMASIINDPAVGPDSYTGFLVTTLQGSTETTFYVLAVYFGAVQVKRIRHTLAGALTADIAGIIAAVAVCLYLFA